MIPLLTADEQRALEQDAIQGWGMPSLVLQETAAAGALTLLPPGEALQVLAGPGNNGGDALALARLAVLQGREVTVWTLHPQPAWTGDAAHQAALWEGLGRGYAWTDAPEERVATFRGWVVDGLFGLGTRLPLPELALGWVRALSAPGGRGFRVLALDLPTGLDPSAGAVLGPAVRADVTACFGHRKVCHGLRPALDACGELRVVPIPLRRSPEPRLCMLEAPRIHRSAAWSAHKRDFGHVGIRAGTSGMSGAAVLAALGALTAGAGLVTVLPDPEVRSEVAAQVPEAMVRPWEGRVPEGIDVLLVGPGGVAEVPDWDGPLVLDASALKPGEGPRWMSRPQTVLTPHAGEFSRLFGGTAAADAPDERLQLVRASASGPGLLVLKGPQTLLAGGQDAQVWVNPTGHTGLATGGTGDLLAGLIAGQMAQAWKAGADLRTAVATAVWLHGAAADRLGRGPLLVRELALELPRLLRELARGE